MNLGSTVKLQIVSTNQQAVPNHHAHFPGFAGFTGLLAAVSMAVGRKGDARLAERLSGLKADDIVVDVGCGPGTAVRWAATKAASVTGVDPAPVMLRVAWILTGTSGTVRYAIGAAEALPLPDGSATVLWTIASAHHWSDLHDALSEAKRILTPSGRLVAIERLSPPGARGHGSHGWTEEQASTFASLCRQHGFVNCQVGRHETGRRTTISVTATAPPASG